MSMEIMCRASFNYMVPALGDTRPVDVDVLNGRSFDNPGWETCGFELKKHVSRVIDWADDEEIQRVHYGEISDLARALTGSDYALVRSHILRNPQQARVHDDLAPIRFVHSDFAPSYGALMREFYAGDSEEARESLAMEGVTATEVANARRMVILQFWRNVGPSKMDLPIAFCDARTVGEKELLAMPVENYAGGGFNFETLAIEASGASLHAWYCFPEMEIDEIVAFRTYDSDLVGSGKPFWTPHSAFRDPDVAEGKPSRYSIELRATCVFKA